MILCSSIVLLLDTHFDHGVYKNVNFQMFGALSPILIRPHLKSWKIYPPISKSAGGKSSNLVWDSFCLSNQTALLGCIHAFGLNVYSEAHLPNSWAVVKAACKPSSSMTEQLRLGSHTVPTSAIPRVSHVWEPHKSYKETREIPFK